MNISYEDMLKLEGEEYWKTLENESQEELNSYIRNHHNNVPLTQDEQMEEYLELKKHYEKVNVSEMSKSGIDAIIDVYNWFKIPIDSFDKTVNYFLLRNMIFNQAKIEKFNALEYGDEWLANQYTGIGEYKR